MTDPKICLVGGCALPATGNEDYPWACRWHIPDAEQERYPVIVEYTYLHVVWVDGDDSEDAARGIESDAYEYTSDRGTLVEASLSVSAPERWDWHRVYGSAFDGEYTTEANAHVQAYHAERYRVKRKADMAACSTAGHPKTQTYSHGTFCDVCGRLPEAVAPC